MKQHYNDNESGLTHHFKQTDNTITDTNLIDLTESSSKKSTSSTLKSSLDDEYIEMLHTCNHINLRELSDLTIVMNVIKKNVIDCMNFSKCDICCDLCKHEPMSDLYLCLDCVYMGSLKEGHWNNHAMTLQHNFCINIKSSKVLCVCCLNETNSNQCDNNQQLATSQFDYIENASQIQNNFVDEVLNEFFTSYSLDEDQTHSGEDTSLDNLNTSYPTITTTMVNINKPPIGMINIGNSCFLNCILQVLLATPSLVHFFLSGTHNCDRTRDYCITCELILIFNYVITNNESDVKLNVENLIRSLYVSEHSLFSITQQDAHEYFTLIIQNIQNEIFVGHNCPYSDSANQYNNSITTSNLPHSTLLPSNLDSFDYINHVFQGSYSLKVFCTRCQNITSKFEPFIDISLGLPFENYNKFDNNADYLYKRENSVNLYDFIETFVKEETTSIGSTTYCYNCDSQQRKVTKFTLNKLPTILCLHMKRFTVDSGVQKLNVKIDFPFHLDLKNFTDATSEHFYNDANDMKACDDIAKNGGTQYILYGVVVHKGAYHSGHYLSYVRINQQWYLCDDETVERVSYETVSQCECYILFYTKDCHE